MSTVMAATMKMGRKTLDTFKAVPPPAYRQSHANGISMSRTSLSGCDRLQYLGCDRSRPSRLKSRNDRCYSHSTFGDFLPAQLRV